jgi:hypothetical protein
MEGMSQTPSLWVRDPQGSVRIITCRVDPKVAIDEEFIHRLRNDIPRALVAGIAFRSARDGQIPIEHEALVPMARIGALARDIDIALNNDSSAGILQGFPLEPVLSEEALEVDLEDRIAQLQISWPQASKQVVETLARKEQHKDRWAVAARTGWRATPAQLKVSMAQFLRDLEGTDLSKKVIADIQNACAGQTPMPQWWSGGTIRLDMSECSLLRRALLLEALAESAMGTRGGVVHKTILIEEEVFDDSTLLTDTVEKLIRFGRKEGLTVIIHDCKDGKRSPATMKIQHLVGNQLTTHRERQLLTLTPESCSDRDGISLYDPGKEPSWWLLSTISPTPIPIGAWFDSSKSHQPAKLSKGTP